MPTDMSGLLPPPAGALDGVKAAFGMHVWPAMPSGEVASRPGTLLAGAIQFEVTVRGRGGHAAMPYLTADPVVATAAAVGALQSLVARETSPFDPAVISVTRMAGGHAFNVFPDTGERAAGDSEKLRGIWRVQGAEKGVGSTPPPIPKAGAAGWPAGLAQARAASMFACLTSPPPARLQPPLAARCAPTATRACSGCGAAWRSWWPPPPPRTAAPQRCGGLAPRMTQRWPWRWGRAAYCIQSSNPLAP